jgi:hypothetical protein
MRLWIKFYDIWLSLVNTPLKNLFDTFSLPVEEVVHNFFEPYRSSDGSFPTIVKTLVDIIDVVVPDNWTVFGLMFGSFLAVFLGATLIKWIVGVVTGA